MYELRVGVGQQAPQKVDYKRKCRTCKNGGLDCHVSPSDSDNMVETLMNRTDSRQRPLTPRKDSAFPGIEDTPVPGADNPSCCTSIKLSDTHVDAHMGTASRPGVRIPRASTNKAALANGRSARSGKSLAVFVHRFQPPELLLRGPSSYCCKVIRHREEVMSGMRRNGYQPKENTPMGKPPSGGSCVSKPEVEELRAENESLKAALERISTKQNVTRAGEGLRLSHISKKSMIEIARAALSDTERRK